MPAETNWAGNLIYQAVAVHHPATVEQVQDLVARLPRVQALGTRHSFSAWTARTRHWRRSPSASGCSV